jgi:hypothetical protein
VAIESSRFRAHCLASIVHLNYVTSNIRQGLEAIIEKVVDEFKQVEERAKEYQDDLSRSWSKLI